MKDCGGSHTGACCDYGRTLWAYSQAQLQQNAFAQQGLQAQMQAYGQTQAQVLEKHPTDPDAFEFRITGVKVDAAVAQELAALRARVAELEARQGACSCGAVVQNCAEDAHAMRLRYTDLEDGLERAMEDLSRKRDECVRLEAQAVDQAHRIMRLTEKDGVSGRRITELQLENDKLRRELRGKR